MAGKDSIDSAKADAVAALDQSDADLAATPAPTADDTAAVEGGADVEAPAPEEAEAETPEASTDEAGAQSATDYSDPKLWGVDGPIAKTFQQVEAQGIDPYEAFQTGLQVLATQSQGAQGGQEAGAPGAGAGAGTAAPDTTGIQGIPSQGAAA